MYVSGPSRDQRQLCCAGCRGLPAVGLDRWRGHDRPPALRRLLAACAQLSSFLVPARRRSGSRRTETSLGLLV
jgi:hypothetical protein